MNESSAMQQIKEMRQAAFPPDVAILADDAAERIGVEMARLFQQLQQTRDVHMFADQMGFVAEEIAKEILRERTRCAQIVIRESFLRGSREDATISAIATRIREGRSL